MSKPPTVWLLLGDRAGDRAQVERLADALGWPYESKTLRYRWPYYRWPTPFLGARLTSLDTAASDPLQPPWPDLVISIGRRSVPVMRWIRKQSGGRTKLVTLGRPRARLGHFDLVVSTPQYRLPQRPNVLRISTPLHHVNEARLRDAGKLWVPRFEHLPRPHIALLVGGRGSPHLFDESTAKALGKLASETAREAGGTLLVSTSFRTGEAPRAALFRAIDAPAYLYAWRPNDPENPYFGYLADADRFIVTSDSVSMLTEALATGRPVQIFSLPTRRKPFARFKEWCYGHAATRWLLVALVNAGILILPRDQDRVKQALIDAGQASELGDTPREGAGKGSDSLERVVARVRTLFPEAP